MSDKETTGAWIHRVLNDYRFDRLEAILQCPAARSILEGVALDSSPDPTKTNSFCNHSQVVNAENIRLQNSVPDDDEGGVSNALSHGNSKSSAADMSLRCLELSKLLCNRIKSLLDCNKLSTLVSRAATRARSLDALQTSGLTAYVCILAKAELNFCACSQSINHRCPP